jgi:hypothetical protein
MAAADYVSKYPSIPLIITDHWHNFSSPNGWLTRSMVAGTLQFTIIAHAFAAFTVKADGKWAEMHPRFTVFFVEVNPL